MEKIRIVFMVLVMAFTIFSSGEGQLVENFYVSSCPNVELVVAQAVTNKFTQTITTGQATLRLFLHDCFVEVYILNFHSSYIYIVLEFLIYLYIFSSLFFIKKRLYMLLPICMCGSISWFLIVVELFPSSMINDHIIEIN